MPRSERTFSPRSYIGVGLTAQMSFNRYCRLLEDRWAGDMRLSPHEPEVLHWAARGKSTFDMATINGISRATVDTCMRRVFDKFGTNDRTLACIRAHELGLNPATGVKALHQALH